MSTSKSVIDPPGWSIAVTRVGVLAILSCYFFVIYAIARGLIPEFGATTSTVLKSALMTLAMSALVVWLAICIELPEMIFGHVLPRRRHQHARCHACGHAISEGASNRCAECGVEFDAVPDSYSLSWRTVRRFLIVLACALVLGIGMGEWWTTSDEQRMQRSVMPFVTPNFREPPPPQLLKEHGLSMSFHRRWPASFSVIEWNEEGGFKPIPLFQRERSTN
jgi:ribosomal protein L37E